MSENIGSGPPTEPLDSTVDLLRRASSGDQRAWGALYDRYRVPLRRFAHLHIPPRVRDLRETDDFVSQTFIRAFPHVARFKHRRAGAYFFYLRRILLNEILQAIRRARTEHMELHDRAADPGPTPIETVLGKELHARYRRAIEQLPRAQARAFVLRNEYGLLPAQIAEILGRTPHAVHQLLLRATRGLALSLGKYRDEAPD